MSLPCYPKNVWNKKLTKQEMKLLEQQYEKEYDFLYDHKDNVAGAKEAMEFGDELSRAHDPILFQFLAYRDFDPLSSDREITAYAFAVCGLGWR